jgi:cyanate permease
MLPTNLASLMPLPANFDPYVRVSGYMWLILTIPLMTFAVHGVRQTGWSSYFGRAVCVAASLLVVGFAISSVIESRIFTPLFPLLLPAAMAGLGVPVGDAVDTRHS